MCSVGDKPIGILHYLICWIKDRCIQQAGAIDMLMDIRAMYIYTVYSVTYCRRAAQSWTKEHSHNKIVKYR